MKKMIMAVVMVLCLCGSVFGMDKYGGETITVKKSDLPQEVLKKVEAQEKFGEYQKYIEMGKGVGVAVRESLNSVVDVSEKFGNTKVGYFTMALVAWKFFAKDVLKMIVGFGILLLVSFVFFISYWRNCMPRRTKTNHYSETGKKTHTTYEAVPLDMSKYGMELGTVQFLHFLCWLVLLGICSLIMFA